MKLMDRVTIEDDLGNNKREILGTIEAVEEILGNKSLYLCVDNKPTHQIIQLENKRPTRIADIDTCVVVVCPRQVWCNLCEPT